MNIIVYTKAGCPWGVEVLEYLKSKQIPFEEREMNLHPHFKEECIVKSGQFKCPTLDIDGHILPDSDAKQVEEYLNNLSSAN